MKIHKYRLLLFWILIFSYGTIHADESPESLNYRGIELFQQGKIDEASSVFNQAIIKYPDYVISYGNRGRIYEAKQEYTKAINDYSKAIELAPNIAKSYYNRGNVYRKIENSDQAISDYTSAILLDPSYTKAIENRGILYWLSKRDKVKACSDLSKACALGNCKAFKMLKCE